MNSRRIVDGLIASLLAGCLHASPDQAIAAESGDRAWVLEHFSDGVTVLRTALPNSSSLTGASLLLSCVEADQRVRLTLSERMSEPLRTAGGGTVLIRGASPRKTTAVAGDYLVARVEMSNAAALTIVGQSRHGGTGIALSIARILARRLGGLELLIHRGDGVITLPHLIAYHLLLSVGPGDATAFRDFIDTCSGEPPPKAKDERTRSGQQRAHPRSSRGVP